MWCLLSCERSNGTPFQKRSTGSAAEDGPRQIVPNRIPGIGAFDFSQVKISMRVADPMEEGIRRGEVLGLDVLLPEATSRVGGFSDACHSLTAATTVPVGREEELIDEMEKVLAEWQAAP
jgi:hypothetical protein